MICDRFNVKAKLNIFTSYSSAEKTWPKTTIAFKDKMIIHKIRYLWQINDKSKYLCKYFIMQIKAGSSIGKPIIL